MEGSAKSRRFDDGGEDFAVIAKKASISLESREEEIIRRWFQAVIEDMELRSLQSLPTRELSSAFPRLIACIARSIEEPAMQPCVKQELSDLAGRMATMRQGDPVAAKVIDDYAILKELFIEAAAMDLRRSDIGALQVFQRLDESFMQFFKAGLEAFMEQHSRELRHMANTDPLTSLYNVRYFRQQLHNSIEMYKRYNVPFSLVMLDLDRLKQLNDREGHEAGDQALNQLARILTGEKREMDIAFRCGGDEFFLLLPGTLIAEAESLARRIGDRAKAVNLETGGREMTGVSIGIVACPLNGTDVGTLRSKADQALYNAKKTGGGAIARFVESGPE